MIRKNNIFAIATAIVLAASAAWAAELHVGPGQTYTTIQSAIDAAVNGDTVIVADGTYTGEGNRDIDFKGKAIIVRSENGSETCIIDCQGTDQDPHRGFCLRTNAEGEAVIEGFTVENGYAPFEQIGGYTVSAGGGICCETTRLTIKKCVLKDNVAETYGGGIFTCDGFSVIKQVIDDCLIVDNVARKGGGICSDRSTVLDILDCTILRNGADIYGGGVSLTDGCRVDIKNCVINDNIARGDDYSFGGGGIYCGWHCELTIDNCVISKNRSTNSVGAGLFCYRDCEATVRNCIITANEAFHDGGGIAFAGTSLIVANCTFSKNSAGRYGGAISTVAGQGVFTVSNSILWGDAAEFGNEMAVQWVAEVDHSIVQGGKEKVGLLDVGSVTWGEGNVEKNPLFADPATDDFHLLAGSWAIDGGKNDISAGLLDVDIEGNARVVDGDKDGLAVVDMGAYESEQSSEPVIKVSEWKMEFSAQQGGPNPDEQIFTVRNAGAGEVSWSILENCPWLSVDPYSGTLTGQASNVEISVDVLGLGPGIHRTYLPVEAPGAVNSPEIVEIVLHVLANQINVPGQVNTIQEAIDHTLEGGEVTLADSIYTGLGNRDLDFRGKNLTIRSMNGPDNCIIDPNGSEEYPHRGFFLHSGEDANSLIEGITIVNGYGGPTPELSNHYGGAIRCIGASPTVRNCIIEGNHGGGIYCIFGADVGIHDCLIRDNNGDGVRVYESNVTVANCKLERNWPRSSGMGVGAIYAGGSCEISVRECTLTNNSSGIVCDGANATITSSAIVYSGSVEGIIYLSGTGISIDCPGSPVISMCEVSGYNDGGIDLNTDGALITNCTVVRNRGFGGIKYSQHGAGEFKCKVTHCTIFDNYSPVSGGLTVYSDSAILENSILWYNGREIRDHSNNIPDNIIVRNSIVMNGWEGENVSTQDPLLTRNGHLKRGSPCIDAAVQFDGSSSDTDVDGEDRVSGDAADIGADEFVDTDGDGLADRWEGAYFVSNTSAQRDGDQDDDGWSNITEYEYSSNPFSIVYYVDASRPDDSGSGQSWATAKKTIEGGVDAAGENDVVIVADGTYEISEEFGMFKSKKIRVRSLNGPANCIIDCEGGQGIRFNHNDAGFILEGFTITGSESDGIFVSESYLDIVDCVITNSHETGIYVEYGRANIRNCEVKNNNRAAHCESGAILMEGSLVVGNGSWPTPMIYLNVNYSNYGIFEIRQSTIADNAYSLNAPLKFWGDGRVTIENSIIWGSDSPLSFTGFTGQVNVDWCDIQGGYTGRGNRNVDPLFATHSHWDDNGTPNDGTDDFWVNGDYHLQSAAGRWDATNNVWVSDPVASACIDGGNPQGSFGQELWPHGRRINVGRYGGTPEASMSIRQVGSRCNLNNDLAVNLVDLSLLSSEWGTEQLLLAHDFDRNGHVDLPDLLLFANDWLWIWIPVPNLLGSWSFDESAGNVANDNSDYGYQGTLINMNDSDWVEGKVGNALAFDGVNDFVRVFGYKGIEGGQSRTVCAWIQTSATGAADIVFWGDARTSFTSWAFFAKGDMDGKLAVGIRGGYVIGTTNVCDGAWHHVAAVFANDGTPDVTEVRLYVDGVEETISLSQSAVVDTLAYSDVLIGSNGATYFDGLIDEVRIYDRPLSDEEIAALAL